MTTNIVAMRCIKITFFCNFSRPNFGQISVSSRPIKKITIGSMESDAAEARARAGAAISAAR